MVSINSSMTEAKREHGGRVFFSPRLDLGHWQLLCTVGDSEFSDVCVCLFKFRLLTNALVCFQNLLCMVIFLAAVNLYQVMFLGLTGKMQWF